MTESERCVLTEQLREAIRERGLTEQELSEATGIDLMPIIYFMRGKDVGLKRASKIAEYLGLELRPANRHC